MLRIRHIVIFTSILGVFTESVHLGKWILEDIEDYSELRPVLEVDPLVGPRQCQTESDIWTGDSYEQSIRTTKAHVQNKDRLDFTYRRNIVNVKPLEQNLLRKCINECAQAMRPNFYLGTIKPEKKGKSRNKTKIEIFDDKSP